MSAQDESATRPLSSESVPAAATLGEVETFLRQVIEGLDPQWLDDRQAGAGAPRVLPALCLWAGLLVCVVRGFSSQLALWRLLSVQGLWSYPRFALSDQAIYKRLAQAGSGPLQQLFAHVSELLAVRLAPWAQPQLAPFARQVLALDETTLDQMARRLPALRELPARDARLLGGKMAGLFDVRRQQWQRIQMTSDGRQNEKVLARQMVADLPRGSLLLADLGYFGFAWFDDLTDQGQWWISRLRARTSYEVVHVFYQDATYFDGIVWLGRHRANRAKHAVRLVQYHSHGQSYEYVTNVRDPQQLPLAEVARLYQRRWDFELAVKLVKRELGLHLLWSSKPAVIELQLWAVLTIAQILHALQIEVAGRAGVETQDVSLKLLVEYLPQLAREGRDPLAFFVEHGRQARFIRPSTRRTLRFPDPLPEQLTPLPPDIRLERTPRYPQHNCHRGRRSSPSPD